MGIHAPRGADFGGLPGDSGPGSCSVDLRGNGRKGVGMNGERCAQDTSYNNKGYIDDNDRYKENTKGDRETALGSLGMPRRVVLVRKRKWHAVGRCVQLGGWRVSVCV